MALQQSGVQLVAQDQAAFMAALAAANGAVQTLGVGAGGAAQKIDQLTTRIEFQKRSLGILSQELTTTSTKYGESSVQAQKKQLAVDKLTASIAKDEKALEQLKQQETQAAQSSNQLEQGLTKAGQSGGKFGEVMTGALRAVGQFAVNALMQAGQAVIGFVTGSEEAAKKYQKTMSEIVGLTGTSAEAVGQLSEEVLKLGPAVGKGPQELGDALYYVLSSGIDAAHAMDVVEASAKAAAAGLGETQTVADLVTSVMNAYGQANVSAAHATDILTQAVKDGKGEPDAYAQALGRVLPIASAAGISFEQVAASIATMTRTGLDANEATTALRGIIGSLEAPVKKTRDALHDMGLSADDVRKSIREQGLLATLQMLMEKSHGNLDVMSALIPNIRALTGVLSTVGSQSEAYTEILGHMNSAQGATEKAFEEATKTVDFQEKALGAAMQALQITLGSVALPAIAGFLKDGVIPMVQGLTEFIQQTKEGRTWLAQLAQVVQAVVMPALLGLTAATIFYGLTALPSVIAALPILIGLLGGATLGFVQQAVAVAAAAAPFVLVAAAIAGVTLAYQDFIAKNKNATDQLLATRPYWTDSAAALADYSTQTGAAAAALAPYAASIQAMREQIHGEIEDLAKRREAGLVSDAQMATELATINQHTVGLQQATDAYNSQEKALTAATAATMTATAQTQAQTNALAANATQTQLTEEEIKQIGKELEKTYKDGTQAVQDYVSQASSLMVQLTDSSKRANDRITVDQAAAYAQQAAAQRAHLGQMLSDYTLAQARLGNITTQQADVILGAIEKQFGVADDTSSRVFLHMEQAIDKFAASGGSSVQSLSGDLSQLQDDAISTKGKMDALAHTYEAELVQNFQDGKIDADQLRKALEGIPARVYSEIYVTTHKREVIEGSGPGGSGPQQRQHGGPVTAGTPYTVGEKGPETFVPQQNGTIVPYGRSAPPASAQQIINVPPPQVVVVQPANTTNITNNTAYGGAGSRSVLGGRAAAATYGSRG